MDKLSLSGTVLANEEIINGLSERGSHPVVRMPLRQWVLKITQYADRLDPFFELESPSPSTNQVSSDYRTTTTRSALEWPQGTLTSQHTWIGRSTGATIKFPLQTSSDNRITTKAPGTKSIEVYSTRPDTIMGVTFIALAPEHSLVSYLTTDAQRSAVEEYVAQSKDKSDLERTQNQVPSPSKGAPRTGVFTGSYVTHPFTRAEIPVYIAEYILGNVGTGAVMGVPAHDERDYSFAKNNNLPIVAVIREPSLPAGTGPTKTDVEGDSTCFSGVGTVCNSGEMFDNKPSELVAELVTKRLVESQLGEKSIRYKLRDWVFSRQRYWGEPIPIYFPVEPASATTEDFSPLLHEHRIRYDQPIPVAEEDLPLLLPDMTDFHPGEDPHGCLGELLHC
jgi:leucyl-tRNA synthetase